jgi:hypothetical protein
MIRLARHRALGLAILSLLAISEVGCGTDTSRSGSSTPTNTTVNPADFVAKIDNPYLPLVPGTRFRYEGTTDKGPETVVVEVTHQTQQILGVTTVVVRDTVTRRGQLVEDTVDWFGQDRKGNVWYFGEDTKKYQNGKVVSTKGSWEAGKNGAQPGIVMKAQPQVGDTYRQEYLKGEAEDMGEVLSVTERATVPFGSFDQVVMVKDFTPLEPDRVEHKYYARGVGFVLEVMVKGGKDRLELVEVTRP